VAKHRQGADVGLFSDAEFIAAPEQLGALHVHAARILIQKDLKED
jgi:hypothetical protein